jgi:hypothetical protein
VATPTLAFKLWVRDQIPCIRAAIMGPVPYTGVHGVIVNGTCRECGMRIPAVKESCNA